jgi:hypothetical protein
MRRLGAKPAPAKAGVNATTRAVISAASGALPGLRFLSRNRPSTPLSAKRCWPPPHRRPADAKALGNPLHQLPVHRGEVQCAPLNVLASPIAVGRDRGQLLARCAAHYHAYLLSIAPTPQTPKRNIAFLIVL